MSNRSNKYENLPMALDAIPFSALPLSEAYEIVVDAIELVPERANEIDEDWIEALRQSRDLEKNAGHDHEEFDAETEEFCHLRKIANVFLRSALENNELSACIRDPRSGETLRLPPSGWLSHEWIARSYVPSGIWQDHAFPNDDEIPGPQAALLAGELRPIFFDSSEFNAWLRETFGPDIASEEASFSSEIAERKRPIDAVIEATLAIWGTTPPAGVPWEKRNKQINDWLDQNDRKKVGDSTIGRALRKMRGDRN
jgi:hypothetical protein